MATTPASNDVAKRKPFELYKWYYWERTLFFSAYTFPKWAKDKSRYVLAPMGAAVVVFLILCIPLFVLFVAALPLLAWLHLGQPPKPRGPHAVGTGNVTIPTIDGEPLRIQVFYPADPKASAGMPDAPWLPTPRRAYADAYAEFGGLHPFISRLVVWVFLGVHQRAKDMPPPLPRPSSKEGEDATGAGAWPVVLFSHGLGGSATTYSSTCAEFASRGAVVVAVEHKDGSAVFSTTEHYQLGSAREKVPYDRSASTFADRNTQLQQRCEELRSVMRALTRFTAGGASRAQTGQAGQGGDASAYASEDVLREAQRPMYDEVLAKLHLDPANTLLVGHSFGGAAVLEFGAASSAPTARTPLPPGWGLVGVEALDPWVMGNSKTVRAELSLPTLLLMTQSMMYEENGADLDGLVASMGARDQACVFIEVDDTRHQDQSDVPAVAHAACQLLCMASARRPAVTMREHLDVCIGFVDMAVPELAGRMALGGLGRAGGGGDETGGRGRGKGKGNGKGKGKGKGKGTGGGAEEPRGLAALDVFFDKARTTIHGYAAGEAAGGLGGTVVG